MSVVMAMEGVNLSFKIGSGPRAAHKQVLDNLSFAVRRGEAFGFLGLLAQERPLLSSC